MYLELIIPDEPTDLKKIFSTFRSKRISDIDWNSPYLWSGNKLPLYLWQKWRNDLNRMGLNWQDFLRINKSRNFEAILWANDKISWSEFVYNILDTIYGPLGQALSNNKVIQDSKHYRGTVKIIPFLNEPEALTLEFPHKLGDASLSFHINSLFDDFKNKSIYMTIREISDKK